MKVSRLCKLYFWLIDQFVTEKLLRKTKTFNGIKVCLTIVLTYFVCPANVHLIYTILTQQTI